LAVLCGSAPVVRCMAGYFLEAATLGEVQTSVLARTSQAATVHLAVHGVYKGVEGDYCLDYTVERAADGWRVGTSSDIAPCRATAALGTDTPTPGVPGATYSAGATFQAGMNLRAQTAIARETELFATQYAAETEVVAGKQTDQAAVQTS